MSEKRGCDVAILGGGPGGYVAAIRAAQLGMRVILVERGKLGGVCLNWGCIPTKALLKSAEVYRLCASSGEYGVRLGERSFDMAAAVKRSRQVASAVSRGVEYLLKQHRVTVLAGRGRLISPRTVAVAGAEGGQETVEAGAVIVATGARQRPLPGVEMDGGVVIGSSQAMVLESVPAKMVIVGAGAVGVEFAYFFNAVGCKVTLLEMMRSVLPGEDTEITALLERLLRRQGIEVVTSARVRDVRRGGASATVTALVGSEQKAFEASHVLLAVGVAPNTDGLGLEDAGVKVGQGGFIETDGLMATSAEGIFAVGDVTGPPLLAHVASAQGIVAAEAIAKASPSPLREELIPRCVYCKPQVAAVGLTEEQARRRVPGGAGIVVGRFPFRANGKAAAVGERDGMVKVVAESDGGRILGVHVIGAEATELVAEAALAMRCGLTCKELLSTVHAHPTLSEALMEAAGDALGEAIHKPADTLGRR